MPWKRIDWQEALLTRWLATCPPDERAALAAGAAQWSQENGRGLVTQRRMREGAEVDAQGSGLPVTPPQSWRVRARVQERTRQSRTWRWMRWQRWPGDEVLPLRSVARQAKG